MPNDNAILSAGKDGAIYQWDLQKNQREVEFVTKGVHYTDALFNEEATSVFAVGSDCQLKEIEFHGATQVRTQRGRIKGPREI